MAADAPRSPVLDPRQRPGLRAEPGTDHLDELEAIRRIRVVDKHEFEDRLPAIYAGAVGADYPGSPVDEHLPLGAEIVEVLEEITGGDRLHFETVRALLDVEQRNHTRARRSGLYRDLEAVLRRGFYRDEADATDWARRRAAMLRGNDTGPAEDLEPGR